MLHSLEMDLSAVSIEPIEDDGRVLESSLRAILDRIAPLAAAPSGVPADEQLRRLGQAINITLDELEELTAITDVDRLRDLIDQVAELEITGDNIEVQIGIAGDLRVDKRGRLVLDGALRAARNLPPGLRTTALREGATTLRRLLALLLLRGWANEFEHSTAARQAARRAIVDAVQGLLDSSQSAT